METMRKYLWIIKAIAKLKLSTQKDVITNFLTAKKRYLPDEKTHADVDDILKCGLCPNMCRFDCPVLQAAKSETYSPAGKARIAYLLEMERVTSDDAVTLMYACCNCSACQKWCPFHFSVGDLLTGVREDIAEKGLTPSSLAQFRETLVRNHTIYEKGSTSLKLAHQEADILYFAGCQTLNKTREIADATLEIMEKAGLRVSTLSEEWCCGAPLSILGFDTDFKKCAVHNQAIINKGGYKTVVCSCPECVFMFKELYPKIGVPLKAEILHTSQFLLKLMRDGKIKLKEHKKEYVYHDPCVLARKLHIYKEPRALIKSIPGLTLVEAEFNSEDTKCCGFGGMLITSNPELSLTIADGRNSELREACPSLVTACPTCKQAFKRVDENEVLDVSELILNCTE